MKTYEKPKLMVLSVSANDALCSTCAVGTRNNGDWNIFDENGNGVFEPGELGLFAEGENCTTNTGVEGYCKFTASQQGLIQLFTS